MSRLDAPRRLCIAPMMDRTDRHFRYFMRLLAPNTWLYTEMVTTGAVLRGDERRHLEFDETEHPVALQLGGSEPRDLAVAAQRGEAAGYDEINLNVGCPSDRVQHACFGAALMLDSERVVNCIESMQSAVDIPVTVKTRLGVDEFDSYDFLHDFIGSVANAGCRSFTLHARKAWLSGLSPKQNREVPPLDYDRVSQIKQDFPHLEIIVNGGIADRELALSLLAQVDGIMLGRAAYRRPTLIAELDAEIFCTGRVVSSIDALQAYLPYLEREIQRGQKLRFLTRHLLGLYAGMPGGRIWRRELGALPEGRSGLARLKQFVDQSLHHGEVDPARLAA